MPNLALVNAHMLPLFHENGQMLICPAEKKVSIKTSAVMNIFELLPNYTHQVACHEERFCDNHIEHIAIWVTC